LDLTEEIRVEEGQLSRSAREFSVEKGGDYGNGSRRRRRSGSGFKIEKDVVIVV
jgi:hypothetical protein